MHYDLPEGVDIFDGPYVASALGLHPVWQLLPERKAAFVALVTDKVGRVSLSHCASLPLSARRINTLTSGRIKYLNASTAKASPNLEVAVPSHLYYPPKPGKPMNG
jgi:hypothetical protein